MSILNVKLADKRLLCVHEFGDPSGRPLLFFHGGGAGASGVFASSCDQIAQQLHLRVLAPDRPGLGGSSPLPHRSVLNWTDDVAELADALHIDSFHVVAHSGGSAYALACAWRLQKRVLGLHLTSPMLSQHLAKNESALAFKTRLSLWCFAHMPDFVLGAMLQKMSTSMQQDPEKSAKDFVRRLPAFEREIVATAENQTLLRTCISSAFAQGVAGSVADLRLIFADWAVPLREIQTPVTLWSGECDDTAPPPMTQALANMLSSARLHWIPEAGHLSTWLGHYQQILASI